MTARSQLLEEASELVSRDRNIDYGPPAEDFARTAGILTALGYRSPAGAVTAPDIAIILMAVKLSRLAETPAKRDTWVDIAGYAACGWEALVESGAWKK